MTALPTYTFFEGTPGYQLPAGRLAATEVFVTDAKSEGVYGAMAKMPPGAAAGSCLHGVRLGAAGRECARAIAWRLADAALVR